MKTLVPTTLEEALVVIAELSLMNQRLEARIKELEARLNKNSKNSSKPPSTDQKGNSRVGKNRGGAKPGHPGYFRNAFPKEQVSESIQVTPSSCPRCGGHNLVSERKPLFHRVLDLLKIQTKVTEYRLERCRCLDCGKHVKASLPVGVSDSIIGPRLTAWVGTASSQWNLSVRNTRSLVEALTGEAFSTATIWSKQQEVGDALAEAYGAVSQSLKQEAWVGADETSWRTCGQKRVLWLASGSHTVLVKILKGRSTACAQELLGENSCQPTGTDRYGAYNFLKGPHQYCLSHWSRDVEAISDLSPASKAVSDDVKSDLSQVFSIWRSYAAGQLARDQFLRRTGYYRRQIAKNLEWGCEAAEVEKLWNFCERSLRDFPRFWTYLRVPGMEPTNNRTERDLRPLVIRRKICIGTGSDAGERYIERVYSVMQTVKRRGANVMAYLEEAVEGYRSGRPSPSLPALACVNRR